MLTCCLVVPVSPFARLPIKYENDVIFYLHGLNWLNRQTGQPNLSLVFGRDLMFARLSHSFESLLFGVTQPSRE